MRLALANLYRPLWTEQIHQEWIKSLLQKRTELSQEQLTRTKNLMNQHAGDALVTDYEHLIFQLSLPDQNDRHVLAAAIHGGANTILTFNLQDFPLAVLEEYNLKAQHPDDLILKLVKLDQQKVKSVVAQHRLALKNPPKTPWEYLETLRNQGLQLSVLAMSDWNF
jgi:hypothetical protein